VQHQAHACRGRPSCYPYPSPTLILSLTCPPGARRCVGWYHSHPQFATHPSLIDIHNQVTQQHAHRLGADEPYAAAIVGPYDRRLPGLASAMAWFYVAHEPDALPGPEQDPLQAGCTPMALAVRRGAPVGACCQGSAHAPPHPQGAQSSPLCRLSQKQRWTRGGLWHVLWKAASGCWENRSNCFRLLNRGRALAHLVEHGERVLGKQAHIV